VTSTPQEREKERRRTQDKGGSLLKELVLIIGVALVLSVLVRTFVAQAFFVPSSSMEDTLLIQDRILASKLSTDLGGVNRGEIVVFTDPGDWLPEPEQPTGAAGMVRSALMFVGLLPSDTGEDLVKRVIGVGGDRVVCCDADGRITVNGVSLDESAYLKPGGGTDQVRFDVVVPADRVFVMGDNRADSSDSRYHLEEDYGTVSIDSVVGRVVAVVWPLAHWSGQPVPAIFENPALDAGTPQGSAGSPSAVPSEEAANPDAGGS
jgi:signal peptidase I